MASKFSILENATIIEIEFTLHAIKRPNLQQKR